MDIPLTSWSYCHPRFWWCARRRKIRNMNLVRRTLSQEFSVLDWNLQHYTKNTRKQHFCTEFSQPLWTVWFINLGENFWLHQFTGFELWFAHRDFRKNYSSERRTPSAVGGRRLSICVPTQFYPPILRRATARHNLSYTYSAALPLVPEPS